MASINLKHTSGNGTILNSPAANPSSDITLKLPSTTGSAGQVLKVASANHSSTNAELEFAADAGGKFASYAIIADVKASNADGGTFTTGDWRTRDLNTEIADADGIVSISSNQFTLQAGSYLIEFQAPVYRGKSHQTRLYNVTGSASVDVGTAEFTNIDSSTSSHSFGAGRVTISGSTVFEIQHRVSTNPPATYGAGLGTSGGFNWGSTLFCLVKIYKES